MRSRCAAGAPQPVGAAVDHSDVEAFGGQRAGQRPGQMELVLDHDNQHGTGTENASRSAPETGSQLSGPSQRRACSIAPVDETPDEPRAPDEDRRGQENDPTALGPLDRQPRSPDEDDDHEEVDEEHRAASRRGILSGRRLAAAAAAVVVLAGGSAALALNGGGGGDDDTATSSTTVRSSGSRSACKQ